jgi:nitrite reductase/ring-hydroxylating ferredoxin subunit
VKNSADRYIERLLAGRRPKAFGPVGDEDLARIKAAIALAGSRAEQAGPDDAFVGRLRGRLAAELPGPPRRQPGRRLLMSLRAGRRRFLRAGLMATAAFAGGMAAESLLSSASSSSSSSDGTAAETDLTPTRGTWYTVATSDRLPEGAVLDFDLGAVTGFVRRTGGRLRAVSGVCTHQACRLALDAPRTGLVCPCHGATFALTGEPLHNFRSHHPLPPLPRLAVREYQGQVQVYGPVTPPPPDRA